MELKYTLHSQQRSLGPYPQPVEPGLSIQTLPMTAFNIILSCSSMPMSPTLPFRFFHKKWSPISNFLHTNLSIRTNFVALIEVEENCKIWSLHPSISPLFWVQIFAPGLGAQSPLLLYGDLFIGIFPSPKFCYNP